MRTLGQTGTTTGLAPPTAAQATAWYNVIGQFNDLFDKFNTNYHALIQQANYVYTQHPELKTTFDDLVNRGSSEWTTLYNMKNDISTVQQWLSGALTSVENVASNVYGTVSSNVQSAVQSAENWYSSTFGEIRPRNNRTMNGLGIIPVLITIGVVSAALAVAAVWLSDAYTFSQRLKALQSAEDKGATPAQAAAMVNQTLGPPSSSSGTLFGINVKWLVIGGIAIFLLPVIVPLFRNRKKR